MTTVMFSFSVTPTESNIDVVAQILRLLGKLDSSLNIHFPASTGEVINTGVQVVTAPAKVKKVKKARKPLTEAEKEVIRQRFAEGRRRAAIARGEVVPEPVKVESKAITPGTPEADAKIKAAIKKSVAKSEKAPMPKNGQKVKAQPAS